MRTGKDIIGIVIHCSAGFGDLASMRRHWRSLGWRSDGYHTLVDLDGKRIQVTAFSKPSNGVKGFNRNRIHICYRGGVERNNVNIAKDTRTALQKEGLKLAIFSALKWIEEDGGDVTKLEPIKGHRDFSPDKNGNGVIERWERIKECPSFDAILEYKNIIPEYFQWKKKG